MGSDNQQNNLIFWLIIFVGLIAGYLLYSQTDTSVSKFPIPPIDSKDTLSQFQNVNLNFAIFDSPDLKALRIFGESPVNPGVAGKNDLFAPF